MPGKAAVFEASTYTCVFGAYHGYTIHKTCARALHVFVFELCSNQGDNNFSASIAYNASISKGSQENIIDNTWCIGDFQIIVNFSSAYFFAIEFGKIASADIVVIGIQRSGGKCGREAKEECESIKKHRKYQVVRSSKKMFGQMEALRDCCPVHSFLEQDALQIRHWLEPINCALVQ